MPPPAADAASIARLIASLSIVTPSPLAPKSRTSKVRDARCAGARCAGALCAEDAGAAATVVAVPARLAEPAQAMASAIDNAAGPA